MLLIVMLLSVVSTLVLAKHGKAKRKYRRYLRGKIDLALALVTLASDDVVIQAISETVEERTWISSIRATWVDADYTIGEGPIVVGVSHSDYTAAEVEEFLENAGSWSEGNKVAQEIAKRKIKIVGTFELDPTSATAVLNAEALNNGSPITTKLNWLLTTGQTVDVWAWNKSGNVLVTGQVIRVQGHANLWPTG